MSERIPEAGDADRTGPGTGTGTRTSRRGLLGMVGAGVAGLALGGAGGAGAALAIAGGADANGGGASSGAGIVPFHGVHQAGIITPAQDRLHFAAFTMLPGTGREELIALLRDWTAAAEALTQGREVGEGAEPGDPLLPPDDTGEALGLGAGHLTLTFGLGRTLFVPADEAVRGPDPYGIRDRLPAEFEPLPSFAFDLLEATQSGGDLCVQACADDPQIAVHAIRNLSRIAAGRAHLTWSQLGFGRTASTSRAQDTPAISSASRTARRTSWRKTPPPSRSTSGPRTTGRSGCAAGATSWCGRSG